MLYITLVCPVNLHVAAKKGAKKVLAISTNKAEMVYFGRPAAFHVTKCFKKAKKMKDRKERMYEQLYQLRSTNKFERSCKIFSSKCGMEANPTLYQHITEKFLHHQLSTNQLNSHKPNNTTATLL